VSSPSSNASLQSMRFIILSFISIFFAGVVSATELPKVPYYGQSFYESYVDENGEIISDKEVREAFKKDLVNILISYHISEKDELDEIVEKCPKEMNENSECYKRERLSYKNARTHLFGKIHLGGNEEDGYFVKDVYCEKEFREGDFDFGLATPGPMQIPFHQIVNTEHTWPKSRFNKKKSRNEQLTDMHPLFPTDSELNRLRGNYLFAEVGEQTKVLPCRQNLLGRYKPIEDIDPRPTVLFYEPPDAHKGNVARALFYFSFLYDAAIDEVEEFYLRKWHKEDPVDEFELDRNDYIFGVQKNRNPMIDFPSIVDLIDDF